MLEVVLCVGVFVLIKLFWNLKLLFILNRTCPLNIDACRGLNNDKNNRNRVIEISFELTVHIND